MSSWRATMPISWPVRRRRGGTRRSARDRGGCTPGRRRSPRAQRRRARAAGGSPPSDRRATCRPRRAATGSRRRAAAAPPSAASNAAHHLGADLEAARADGGAQRDAQIVRPRAEFGRRARAPPRAARPRRCRASRRGRPRPRRCADRRPAPGCSRRRTRRARRRASSVHERVRLDARERRRIVARAHAHDRGAVDLARDVERPRDAGRAQQPPPVLRDGGRHRRPSLRAQVQRVERRRADAAGARREPVHERRRDQLRAQQRQLGGPRPRS